MEDPTNDSGQPKDEKVDATNKPAVDPPNDGKADATNKPPVGPPQNGKDTDSVTPTVPPEPPLNWKQKFWAGFFIISAISLALWVIIAYWPDKMPTGTSTTYRYELMHITLIDPPSPAKAKPEEKPKSFASTEKDLKKRADDSAKFLVGEAERAAIALADKAKEKEASEKNPCATSDASCHCTIQFGALILILVAAAGFLGNMVYISSSFATFVGAEKFRRSWILWYFIKPFTASGLAIFIYFSLNNSNSNPGVVNGAVNLNGIMAGAALAGLFTDIATQKLKEIFTAVFKPTDNRPDKLTDESVTAQSVDLKTMQPAKIDVNQTNQFVITGHNLDPQNIIVTILGKKIDPIAVTPVSIKFKYDVDPADKGTKKFPLLITDAKGVKVDGKDMVV
ncbi:MAG TPA: hypothetical protein VGN20_27780 [Mucilaginibacter sp.]|jgi:hypothetical protein